MQICSSGDHNQPVPVNSGVIPPTHADSTTADSHMQLCSSSDHSQPVPVNPGVIPPAHADSTTTGGHTQLCTSSNHSQPVPVSSGVIPPAPAATTPGSTAPLHHLTNDHRHGHIPAGLGMIPSLRANLASTEPLQPVSDHSQPVPISFGVISPACTDPVSGAPENHMQPRPMIDRSQPVPVDSGAIFLARADQVSESTNDHRHGHLLAGLGVIPSPRVNPTSTEQLQPMSDRSQPVPVGSGVISPACNVSVFGPSLRVNPASTEQLQPMCNE